MRPRATSFPKVERIEERDPRLPVFWTAYRFPTKDAQFPLAQVVQVRTPYGITTGWQVWAGTGKWAFHTEAETMEFLAQRFQVGPRAGKTVKTEVENNEHERKLHQ